MLAELTLPGPPGAIVADQSTASDEDPRSDVRLGLIVLFLFFGLLLGWSAFARLDAATLATGKLAVDGQRQTIQHRDGGVVGELLVKEGQTVAKGQLLIRLTDANLQAQEQALSTQAITLLAQRARLEAEQAGSGVVATPREFASLTKDEDRLAAQQALQTQQRQLQARLATVRAQRGAFGERGAGVSSLGQGYGRQLAALDQQIASLDEELNSLREVAAKGFVSQNRIRALERTRAELEGQRGQYSATIAQSRSQASETRLQSLEAQSSYLERSAAELREVQSSLNDLLPRLAAARDSLARTEIRSPVAGTIVGLQVFTPGGVIGPGQKLMDIVPTDGRMIVEARIPVEDGDDIRTGQQAHVRFDSLHERSLAPLKGVVARVSADSFTDEQSGASFFTASIEIPPAELARVKEVRGKNFELRAGIPVSMEIPLRKRTALQYFLEPLTGMMRRSGTEH